MFYQLVVSFQPVSIIIAHQGVAKCNEAHRQFIQPPPKILHRCSWVGPYMYARNEGVMIWKHITCSGLYYDHFGERLPRLIETVTPLLCIIYDLCSVAVPQCPFSTTCEYTPLSKHASAIQQHAKCKVLSCNHVTGGYNYFLLRPPSNTSYWVKGMSEIGGDFGIFSSIIYSH